MKITKKTLEKMGFEISGHWAQRGTLSLYLPTLTYQKLVDDIHLDGVNLGKAQKLNEIKKALSIY